MSTAATTKPSIDLCDPDQKWARFDALTPEQRHAAALADPDAQPITPENEHLLKRTPPVKIIRQAYRLSQEEFAEQFRIPIGTLRDWEQGRVEPDAAARAYLRVIAYAPDVVREALAAPRGRRYQRPDP